MQIRYEATARADFRNIIAHGVDNHLPDPVAYVHSLRERVMHLADITHPGRRARVANTREWVLSGTPYIVIFQITDDVVTVLRVLHGARDWP